MSYANATRQTAEHKLTFNTGVKTNGAYTGSSEIEGNEGKAELSVSGGGGGSGLFHSSVEVSELKAGQTGVHELVNNTGVVIC